MSVPIKPWTEPELTVLKQYYIAEPTAALASRLNRSVRCVRSKANLLGVRKAPDKNQTHPRAHRWTEAEDELLRKLWLDVGNRVKGHTSRWAAHKLGVTVQQARNRAAVLGLRRCRIKEAYWSDAELELLDQWLHLSPPLIRARLKKKGFHRTESAIVVQRWRRFGGLAMATGGYSATQLAELLGTSPRPILGWIEKKWLAATPRGDTLNETGGPGDRWIITPSAVRKFIVENPIQVTSRVNLVWMIDLLAGK